MNTILLDMDHTVIRPQEGRKFPKDENDWEFMPGILDALKKHAEQGCRMFIVSNQGGIEFGHTTAKLATEKINEVIRQANEAGANFINGVFCSTNDKNNYYRKPNVGMYKMIDRKYKLDKNETVMVGDMDSDREFANNNGLKYYDVKDFVGAENNKS